MKLNYNHHSVFVASIVRIHFLSEFMKAADVTWLMGPVFIWSTIEPSVAVVCACLPHLAPLARLAHRSILSSLNSQSAGISSERPGGQSSSGQGPQRNKINHGPKLDYGFDKTKRNAHDDEIGLTNYVTVGPNRGTHPSNDSLNEDIGHNQSIAVHSSLVQSASTRPPW
jgi:hypothetical protein